MTDEDIRQLAMEYGIFRVPVELVRAFARAIEQATIVRCAKVCDDWAEKAEPVAWVPIHPRSGPLWSMATDHPDAERLPSYQLREVYFHPPRRELSDGELAPLVQKAVADVYGHCGALPSKDVLAVVSAVLREVGQTERRELSDELREIAAHFERLGKRSIGHNAGIHRAAEVRPVE